MDAIEDTLVNFEDIANFLSVASQYEWEKMVRFAFHRFVISDMSNHKQLSIMKEVPENGLVAFLKMAVEYKTRQTKPAISGPDGLNWDFYHSNGGSNQLAPFLFGTASQHRN
jgi:hypothetical protein